MTRNTWVHCDNCENFVSTEDDQNGNGWCRDCMLEEIGNMTDKEIQKIWYEYSK